MTDEQWAATIDLARKCGVIIVQKRTGKVQVHEKTLPRRPRGKEVGGFELKRRMAKIPVDTDPKAD